jgi:hypothetical protein
MSISGKTGRNIRFPDPDLQPFSAASARELRYKVIYHDGSKEPETGKLSIDNLCLRFPFLASALRSIEVDDFFSLVYSRNLITIQIGAYLGG